MPDIVSDMRFDWDSQAAQHEPVGEPGITLFQQTIEVQGCLTMVDYLLYRDDDGVLVGILYHYNENNPWQKPGTVNLWVKPDRQGEGIATTLIRDAWHRWEIIYEEQTLTPATVTWIDGLVKEGLVDEERTRFIDEDLPDRSIQPGR